MSYVSECPYHHIYPRLVREDGCKRYRYECPRECCELHKGPLESHNWTCSPKYAAYLWNKTANNIGIALMLRDWAREGKKQ